MGRLKRTVADTKLPILINCNEFNKEIIIEHIKHKNHYGMNPDNFKYFSTYTLAVYDSNGKYCISDQLKLIRKPSGTASAAEYLQNQLIANVLTDANVKYVYFSGMENLLEVPCDPMLLGMMNCEHRLAAGKCVRPMH